jgi:hypothetical protein
VANCSAGGIVIDAICGENGGTLAVGAGQTQRRNQTYGSVGQSDGGSSTEPGTGGNVTMSWAWTNSIAWAGIALPLMGTGGGQVIWYGA